MQKFNRSKTKYLKLVNMALPLFFHEKKPSSPFDVSKAANILVIDPGLIGDLVMAVPFLRTLKRNAPLAKITLVCGRWGKDVLKGQDVVDKFICIDTGAFTSLSEMRRKRKQLMRALRQVNQTYYDFALEPRGDLRYILLMHYCNAGRKVSYNYTGGECLLTDVVIPSRGAVHLVEDKLYFAKQIGCRAYKDDRYPKLRLTMEQKEENEVFQIRHGLLGKRIIGIHPGASLDIKQWDGFCELAAMLGTACDSVGFLVFEGPGEGNAAAQVAKAARVSGAQAVISKTGIVQYMQRLAMCDAVICNDSGAGHLARAYGVTVFVVFGPVEPAFARPYALDRVYVFSDDSLECKPCFLTECPLGCACLGNVSVHEVCGKVMKYMQRLDVDG